MSPTVFRAKGFRFFSFSREEPRMHVHVHGENGEAKFWMEPNIELAQNYVLFAARVERRFLAFDNFPWFRDAPIGKLCGGPGCLDRISGSLSVELPAVG